MLNGDKGFINSSIITFLGIFMMLGTSACTNSGSKTKFNLKGGNNNPFPPGFGGSGTGIFGITQILPSNIGPSSIADILGDGSGSIGNFCGISSQTFGQGTPSATCECYFSYLNPLTQQPESSVSPIGYSESDLARCNYATAIPSGVLDADIQIRVTSVNAFTNKLSFSTDGAASVFDTTNPNNYVNLRRYQCRDHVFISHMFDANMYDPFQSEDSRYIYPLNFFATDIGSAMETLVLRSQQSPGPFSRIECSFQPESYSPLNPRDWENPLVFSQAPSEIDGSQTIFPPSPQSDRYTVVLSKVKTGVFREAVNLIGVPGTVTAEGTSLPPPGFGARPIPAGNNEVCPSVPLPLGYKWAKLWAFEGTLVAREFVRTTTETVQTATIACNPGEWALSSTPENNLDPNSIFEDCGQPGTASQAPNGSRISEKGFRYFMNAGSPFAEVPPLTVSLAARVLSITNQNRQVCVKFPNDRAGASLDPTVPAGSDLWERVGTKAIVNMPFDLDATGPFTHPNAQPSPGAQATPSDGVQPGDLGNLDGGLPRIDFLFTVSPVTVSREDMINEEDGTEQYFPWSFKRHSDCPSLTPLSNPNCVAKRNTDLETVYRLRTDEITLQPTQGSGTKFPICVLQPINP